MGTTQTKIDESSYLANNIRESGLKKFLEELDEDEVVQSFYDTMGFVNELYGLEEQYFQLRDKISFVPFVKTLLQRINDYVKLEVPAKDQDVLTYLYTAILSKMCSIRKNLNYVSVIDPFKSVDASGEHIAELSNVANQEKIVGYYDKYKSAMYMKIELAIEFIINTLIPEIDIDSH